MGIIRNALMSLTLFGAMAMADESQFKVAKELLLSFGSGDSSYANKVLGTSYTQHNQHYEDGRDALLSAIPHLKGTNTKVLAGFVDSGFAVVLSEDYFKGDGGTEQNIAFDIFRFEGGKIVEHWDNIAPKASVGKIPNFTQGGNQSSSHGLTQDVRLLAEQLIQSSIDADSKDSHHRFGMVDKSINWHSRLQNLRYTKIHKILSHRDLALVVGEGIETSPNSQRTAQSPTTSMSGKRVAIYDLFQMKNGVIAAHFGITEEVLEAANAANSNTKFNF